jgi:RHS repeat-associated protein
VTTVFVYDPFGQLAQEYGGPAIPASESGTRYITADHLGSTRLVTKPDGTVAQTYDYLPFGQEFTASSDTNRIRFTGKERDAETGLDYFGARYFSGAQGRFTGPDPLLNSGRPWEPQSWNRYAYALNNPLRFNDPTGLYEWAASGCADDDKKCLKQYQQNQDRFRQGLRSLEKARDAYKKGSREYNRLDSALQAYGKENDPNGVKVGFAALSGSAEGRTIPENNLASFTVLFDPKKIGGSGTDWGITVGHEGTHVSDFRLPMSDLQLLTPFQWSIAAMKRRPSPSKGCSQGLARENSASVRVATA